MGKAVFYVNIFIQVIASYIFFCSCLGNKVPAMWRRGNLSMIFPKFSFFYIINVYLLAGFLAKSSGSLYFRKL